jgi:hypothetical protein
MSDQLPPPSGTPVAQSVQMTKTPKIIVWAFVLSLFGFLILTAFAAVAMTLTGWKQIKATGKGKGLAVATLIISGLWLIVLIFSLANPSTSEQEPPAAQTSEVAANPTDAIEANAADTTPTLNAFDQFLASEGLASPEVCDRYEAVQGNFEERFAKRNKAIGSKPRDERAAKKFISGNEWTKQKLATDLKMSFRKAAETSLSEIEGGEFKNESIDRYLTASTEACGIDLQAIERSASGLDARISALRELAANVPWYPKGFNLLNNVAWKWTKGACTTSFGYCWTMEVISDTGCPNGLYAEVNISQGDTIVGYSNDVLGSLPPMQKAKLEFRDFGGSGTKSAQLTKFNCY